MSHGEPVKLVVRGLGRAEIALGELTLVPEAGMLFPLALLLAQRAAERIPRATLIELLWPGTSDAAGRHSLRQALYRLRRAGLRMEDRADDVRVAPDAVDSDLSAVLRHDWPYRAEPPEIEQSASVLPGFVPEDGSALAEWFEQLRSRLAAQYRTASLHRISVARREGRWGEVDHWGLMCLQGDPLNEEATLARAEAAAMRGAKNNALEILDSYLRELGDRTKTIALPTRLLRRRISEMIDTTGRRVTATSAPFIGRHEQVARAQDTLDLAKRGEASVLWYVGPPGIGKSRLLREVARASRMAGWCAVSGATSPSHEDRPFALLTEILPQLLEAPGALGADPDALTMMRQMGRTDTGEEPLAPEEVRGRQHAVYLSWVELMDAILAETPLAILVDDAHWSDALTLLMFARFLESRPQARIAVILSTRKIPTRDDSAAQRLLGAAQERVGPWSDEEMRTFALAAGLASDEAFEETTRRLGTASGGNPLFLGHLVHQHQTRGVADKMPVDLATLIDEQMRGLSREATRLLQACALLGRHATLPRVERVLGLEAPALVSPFGELDDMLALPSEPGQPLAPHDLWTERVRHGMTAGVFRSLAVSTARVLEADAGADGGIELSWDAARLYQESGEKQLAYNVMMRCAEYLTISGATPESCRAFATAATVAGTTSALHRALAGQLKGLHAMSEFASAEPVLAQLRKMACEDPSFSLTAEEEILALEIAHFQGASADMQEELARLAKDDTLSVDCRLYAIKTGLVTADNFHDSKAQRRFQTMLGRLREKPSDAAYIFRTQLVALTMKGQFARAQKTASRLLSVVRARPNRTALTSDLRVCSVPYRRGGQLGPALELLEEAQTIARQRALIYGQFRAVDMRAGTLLDYYRLPDVFDALREAEALFSDSLGAFNRESLDLTWAFWSIAADDWTIARQRSARIAPFDPSSRSRHAILSAALRLQLSIRAGSEAEATRLLQHLNGQHASILLHGGSDQVALAIHSALLALNSRREATRFANDYVKSKRLDRTPVPPQLQP